MGKSIVVTSGKGGVGKTTCTANIGSALADKGYSVVMIDADIGLRNLDVVLGLENRIVFNVIDVAQGRCDLKKALVKDRRYDRLFLLPAAQSVDKTAISPMQMQSICVELKEKFDYVIIDCPAGIEQGYKNSVAGADEAVVVTTPEIAAIRDADRIIGLLHSDGIYEPQLIINRIRPEMIKSGDMMSVPDIESILGIRVVGLIPDDRAVVVSTNRGEAAIKSFASAAAQEFRSIALRLSGENVPLSEAWDKLGIGFMRKIFRTCFH